MVASPEHPELMLEKKKKKMLKKVWSYTVDFCIRFRTIRDNPTYRECYRTLRYMLSVCLVCQSRRSYVKHAHAQSLFFFGG